MNFGKNSNEPRSVCVCVFQHGQKVECQSLVKFRNLSWKYINLRPREMKKIVKNEKEMFVNVINCDVNVLNCGGTRHLFVKRKISFTK